MTLAIHLNLANAHAKYLQTGNKVHVSVLAIRVQHD